MCLNKQFLILPHIQALYKDYMPPVKIAYKLYKRIILSYFIV